MVAGILACASVGCSVSEPLGPVQDPSFSIDLRYWGNARTQEQQASIEAAVERWEAVISRGVADAQVTGGAGCGPGSPAMEEVVDDIVVWVRIIDIDALAESGPCKVRQNNLPITATIWLDGPDRLNRLGPDLIQNLVTHELAHALGFGNQWPAADLLGDPAETGGEDPHFHGPNAIAEFNLAGGTTYPFNKVPVERFGGAGTADSHWRASVFGEAELMSFTVTTGLNPLSRITVAAMADIGYEVDLLAADAYALPGPGAPNPSRTIGGAYVPFSESPPRWSITVTDPSGAIVSR